MPTYRTFLRQAIAAALALLLAPASALCFTVGDLKYEFQSGSDSEVVVSGLANSSAINITIPSTVQYDSHTYHVTSIGDGAFSWHSGLTSVTIPDSVTSIGGYAFEYCSGLTNVSIPDSITSIGAWAFSDCSGLTSVSIPDSVTSIGYMAFSDCSALNAFSVASGNSAYQSVSGLLLTKDGKTLLFGVNGDIVIPGSVTSIEDDAFSGHSGLASVTIPDSVTNIGSHAFSGCSGLTSVTIPDSVTSIGGQAFSDCSELTSVTIPDRITSIGYGTFWGCRSLASVAIPDSVTSIGDVAFYACRGLTSVIIPESVTSIGSGAFLCCSGLTNVTIPDSVTSIGSEAFCWCIALTSVTIPDSVTSIGDSAFSLCSGLTSIDIPDSVTNIGSGAFSGCSGLTSVIIPDRVTSIGENAFFGCSGLTSVTIPNSVMGIGNYAFSGCSGLKLLSVPGAWEGSGMLDDVWGEEGKPKGCVVVYRTSGVFPPAQNEAEVAAALAEASDGRLGERIRSVEEYEEFRAWVSGKSLDAKAVMESEHAWISYALGTEELFENEPNIMLSGMSVEPGGSKRDAAGAIIKVAVTVKDGDASVPVDAKKVSELFKATRDLSAWDGPSTLPATATPTGSDGATMHFEVAPADANVTTAFLRLALPQ